MKSSCPVCAQRLTPCPVGDRSLICEPCLEKQIKRVTNLRQEEILPTKFDTYKASALLP